MELFLLSTVIGYLLYKIICIYGINKNGCPYTINQLKFNNKKLHMHHWLIHTIIILISLSRNYHNEIFLGLNFGGVIHGIYEYKNWYFIYY